MNHSRWITPQLAALVAATLLSVPVAAQQEGTDNFGPYNVVEGWFKPSVAGYIERPVSVFAESPNRIFVTTDRLFKVPGRGETAEPPKVYNTIQVRDANGNVAEHWAQWDTLIDMPHYITESPYDPTKAVWVVSRYGHQVFKFSNDGKQLLLKLGEKYVEKSDPGHFGQPTSLAFLPDGSFYVADGYDNRRVVKFDKDGKYLFEWGTAGSGPGQFAANGQVHGIAIDADHRIYVCDRGNKRVQIFDENGKYLDEWDNITGASDIKLTTDGMAWVTSGVANRIIGFDAKTGVRKTYWGMYGMVPGGFDDPHYISVDSQGNLFIAIWSLKKNGLEKYVAKPNADPGRLISSHFVVPRTDIK